MIRDRQCGLTRPQARQTYNEGAKEYLIVANPIKNAEELAEIFGVGLDRVEAVRRIMNAPVRRKKASVAGKGDVNSIDPQIHNGTPTGVMSGLRNIFHQPGDAATVPEMLASYRAVQQKLPELRRNSGSKTLFSAAVFQDLSFAAIDELQKRIAQRSNPQTV
jgi:3-methyladenine DNA glycosylase/8-oxoguanine DNA glycosylase